MTAFQFRKVWEQILAAAGSAIGFFRLTRGARMLLLTCAILMVAWSFLVPIFESPDEPSHWRYARYLRHNKQLPVYNQLDQEANSPPLYYLVVAPFARYSDVPPHLIWLDIDGLHVPSAPRFMQNTFSDFGQYWPIRITRLVTILISLVTVLFCYKAGVEAGGNEKTGLLAGALTAFLPQFSFRGMNISNDAMVAALGSVTVYLIVRIVKRGANRRIAIATAVAMAGALLSKASAIFFPGAFALAILTERIPWTRRLKLLGSAGITVLLAAPWLLRNQLIYGDVLAKKAMFTAVWQLIREKPITSPYFVDIFPRLTAMSFVGMFGWMNVVMPDWIYQTFEVLAVLALVGYGLGLARRKISWRLTAVLLSIVLLNLLVVIELNLTFDQPQGRYMFPSLAATAVLAALGLENLLYWPGRIWRVPIGALFLLNVYVLIMVVVPAYWPPPQMATAPVKTRLAPTSLSGMSRAGSDDDLTVSGDKPEVVIDGDVPASQYNFLTFKIRGGPGHGTATGAVYLKRCGCDPAQETRIPFRWRCDGAERQVIIPLYSVPEWQGRLAGLRLSLLDPSDASYAGSSLQVREIELVSFISDTNGP